MSQLIRSGLHRALTWRYILVTVAALVIIEALVLLFIIYMTPPYTIGMQPDVYLMEQLKNEAADILEADQRDELQQWLLSIDQPVINLTVRDNWLRVNLSRFPQQKTQMMLVFHETDGVIASNPPTHPFSQIQQIEELPGPLDSTLFNSIPERPGPDGVMTRNGNSAISAYPIQQEDGTLLALLILINLATDVPPSLMEVLMLIGISLLVITLAVGLLGGLFGSLSSRFLVRRVRHLSETTGSWGEGDFSQPVVQSGQAQDELDELAHHLDQLRPQIQESLALREELAVQGERQRIAQELHDSVKQQLFTLRMNLATVQTLQQESSGAIATHVQNAVSLAESAQQELTAIINVFHQPAEQRRDSATQFQTIVSQWSKQTQIAAHSKIDEDLALTIDIEHALRRILQESLANVYKHSGADSVKVQLTQDNKSINLKIVDNGVGFEASAEQSGFGLTSLRERVKKVGGRVELESSSEGTTVNVQIPNSE